MMRWERGRKKRMITIAQNVKIIILSVVGYQTEKDKLS